MTWGRFFDDYLRQNGVPPTPKVQNHPQNLRQNGVHIIKASNNITNSTCSSNAENQRPKLIEWEGLAKTAGKGSPIYESEIKGKY